MVPHRNSFNRAPQIWPICLSFQRLSVQLSNLVRLANRNGGPQIGDQKTTDFDGEGPKHPTGALVLLGKSIKFRISLMIWYVFGQINDMFISESMNIFEGSKQIITVLQIGCTCHTAPLKMIPQSFPPWDLLLPTERLGKQKDTPVSQTHCGRTCSAVVSSIFHQGNSNMAQRQKVIPLGEFYFSSSSLDQ